MKRIYRVAKPLSIFLAIWVFMISGPHQAVAALVGTERVFDAERVQSARELIHSLMAREDIQAALVREGIDPREAQARAESLSDAEAGAIKAFANVHSANVVGMLQRAATAVPDGKVRVGVGFSAVGAVIKTGP